MYLKRIYDEADLERYKAEKEAAAAEAKAILDGIEVSDKLFEQYVNEFVEKKGIRQPKLAYLALANTGTTPEQNFSKSLVAEALQAGLMEIHEDELIFRVSPESLHYVIKRRPGRWCLHCGEKLGDDEGGELARLHMAEKHAGKPSPDPKNPAGYENLNGFECTLDDEQHEKYRVKEVARAPIFHTKDVSHG